MKLRVTQLDVARAAGVHSTTVSLALRNSPSIPESTRKRIQALADKLGYHPDPALRALVTYRKSIVLNRRTEKIAYVTHHSTRWGWRDIPAEEQYFKGAERKAAECGYQLEHFWLGEPDLTPRRLSNMLFHRAIGGMLLASHPPTEAAPLDFEWERISAVSMGHLPRVPGLHRVTNDPTGDVRHAMRRIAAEGYRRVGLILPQEWDDLTEQAWSMGFTVQQNRLPPSQRIPILFHSLPESATPDLRHASYEAFDRAELAAWYSAYKPDVILGSLPRVSSALRSLRLRIPTDVAFVDLQPDNSTPEVAGVRQNCERVGEVAVEILVHQLQLNLRGLPSIPTTTLVEGVWQDGASLRRAAA